MVVGGGGGGREGGGAAICSILSGCALCAAGQVRPSWLRWVC